MMLLWPRGSFPDKDRGRIARIDEQTSDEQAYDVSRSTISAPATLKIHSSCKSTQTSGRLPKSHLDRFQSDSTKTINVPWHAVEAFAVDPYPGPSRMPTLVGPNMVESSSSGVWPSKQLNRAYPCMLPAFFLNVTGRDFARATSQDGTAFFCCLVLHARCLWTGGRRPQDLVVHAKTVCHEGYKSKDMIPWLELHVHSRFPHEVDLVSGRSASGLPEMFFGLRLCQRRPFLEWLSPIVVTVVFDSSDSQ